MNSPDTDRNFPAGIDATISCGACDAVCCRLTVVIMAEDVVPQHLRSRTTEGLDVMARGADGWCIALDRTRMCCGIYAQRPGVCRKFAMGGAYCRAERANYARDLERGIPLKLRG